MRAMRVLIMYENTGGGHRRMANIIKDMLENQNQSEVFVQVVMDTPSRLFEDTTIKIVNLVWNWMIRKDWITLADIIVNFICRIWLAIFAEAISSQFYYQQLDTVKADLIVCTCDGFSKFMGIYAKRKNIPFFMIPGEPLPFHDLVSKNAVHLVSFEETKNAIQSFDLSDPYFKHELSSKLNVIESLTYLFESWIFFGSRTNEKSFRGLDRKWNQKNDLPCVVLGPIAEKHFFHDPYSSYSKSQRKSQLGFPSSQPCVLVISGSLGGEFVSKISQILFKSSFVQPITIIAFCAKDQKSMIELQGLSSLNSKNTLIALPYVNNMQDYLRAGDVVFARPSAGVFSEAILCSIPMLLPCKATTNDHGALQLLKKYKLGETFDSENLTEKLDLVLEQHSRYQSNIAKLSSNLSAQSWSELQNRVLKVILRK